MKKLLFALATLLIAGNAMAERVVTIYPSDFTEMTSAEAYSVEKDGITVSVTRGMAKSNHIRIYKNELMTIEMNDVSAPYGDVDGISLIEISCIAEDYSEFGPAGFENNTAGFGSYTFEGYYGYWEPEDPEGELYEHATYAYLFAGGGQVRVDEIIIHFFGDDPVQPTERTDSPSASKVNYVEHDGDMYYNAYTVTLTPAETEPDCTIWYRIGVMEDGVYVFGEWMEYVAPFNVDQPGSYRIEAYAITEGKLESYPIADEFVVSRLTDVEELFAGKTVANVRYFNVAGQEMQQPAGLTIMVTTFTDGTTSAVKAVK